MFLSFLTHQSRLAATVDNASRGALALFQPLLYSHDAEAFIEGGFQDLEKGTQEFLKEPNGEVALSPVFLVRDVLLVASLSRNKPQATCGICHLEQGHMVGFFKNFFMPSELSVGIFGDGKSINYLLHVIEIFGARSKTPQVRHLSGLMSFFVIRCSLSDFESS